MYVQKTPQNTPKHPFSWPELESGPIKLKSGQNGPQLGKMFEKWAKLFMKWAKKFIHIYCQFLLSEDSKPNLCFDKPQEKN